MWILWSLIFLLAFYLINNTFFDYSKIERNYKLKRVKRKMKFKKIKGNNYDE